MPPILIKMQYHVDQEFMFRLIKYSSETYSRYKVLPIVLVVATKSFAASFEEKFTISPNRCLLEASSAFWAKKCLLLSVNTISDHFVNATIDPMDALGFFLTRHKLSKLPEHHRTNATLMTLSSIVKEILSHDEDKIKKIDTIYQLNQAKRLLQEIVEETECQGECSSKKAKKNAKEGILFIEQVEKDLKHGEKKKEDTTSTSKYTNEDAQFIENMTKSGKRKDWRYIFNQGKKNGLFRSYKSTDSLKSSHYHIQKRKQNN
ncbi:unnamed protein product [Rhizopus stolonifer]